MQRTLIFCLAVLLLVGFAPTTGVAHSVASFTGPAAEPPQPTALTVVHHSGQSFITWTERADLSGESYRVYRHNQPITAGNVGSATLLYAVPAGSARFFANHYRTAEGAWAPRYAERLVVPADTTGVQVAAGTGLLVWTPTALELEGSSGVSYYAVTTVLNGVENRVDFSAANVSAAVTETVANPLPVELSAAVGEGGHLYIQYMDLHHWNPTFHAPNETNQYYGLTATAPDVANAIQYAYDYVVYEPVAALCEGTTPAVAPVFINLHGWDDNSYGPFTTAPDPFWCAYAIYPIDVSETWYFGFARQHDYRQGGQPSAGDTIVNYTEQRILRMIDDLLRKPPGPAIDPQRIYLYGHSMGGSGTLALALRYPNLFAAAYASEPMTNYRTSGDGGGVDWRENVSVKWGAPAANLPVAIAAPGNWAAHLQPYQGVGVWDWQNHQQNLRDRQADEMVPIGIAHGRQDTVIEWSTQGEPVYGAFNAAHRAWGGSVSNDDHTWQGFLGLPPTLQSGAPFANFQVVRNETVPGLSNGSTDLDIPPTTAGGYHQTIRWSASWDPWDGAPVDTVERWQISLCTIDPAIGECGSGAPQTVDVTPRRRQHFVVQPGKLYHWENRRVADNSLVAAGTVTADANGLVTVAEFAVSATGNRLALAPTDGVSPTATPTPATPTPTPTATATPAINFCPAYRAAPLYRPRANQVTVGPQDDWIAAIENAAPDTEILLQAGEYLLTQYSVLIGDNITVRGANGDRDAVRIRGQGYGVESEGLMIAGNNVTIADLTMTGMRNHAIAIKYDLGAEEAPHLYNVHLYDIGTQHIKGTPGGIRNGLIACSTIGYTPGGAKGDYNGAIDIHTPIDWTVRDNTIYNIRGDGSGCVVDVECGTYLSGPAILMWNEASGTVVERNRILDSYRNIALGLGSGHAGGAIRNNFIYQMNPGDAGIELQNATNLLVEHNTVILNGDYPGAIEFRDASNLTIRNNLLTAPPWDRGNTSNILVAGNIDDATVADLAAPGDPHLVAGTQAIGAGVQSDVTTDIDGDVRNGSWDVGADQYRESEIVEKATLYLPYISR